MNTTSTTSTTSTVSSAAAVTVSGYGPDGSGPCVYTVLVPEGKSVAEAYASAYPEEARWGYWEEKVVHDHQCCPALIDQFGGCPECGGTVPNW